MLPAFSGRATHLRTLTPSLPYAKHSTPNVRNELKGQPGKGKVSENGIGEAPGFGFRILLEARSPLYRKKQFVHCIRPESGVRYRSAEKSREFRCGRRYWP